jgi:hypothetical protein
VLVLSSIRCDPPPQSLRRDRRPGEPTHVQHAGVENVSRPFHAHREPQQSTRFGPPRNNSFSRSKDRPFLMRLPSEPVCACAPPAATPLRLTGIGNRRTISVKKERKERKEKRKTIQKITKNLFVNQNLLRDQFVVINRSLFAGVKPQEAI